MKKKLVKSLSVAMAASMLLVGCGQGATDKGKEAKKDAVGLKFKESVDNQGTPIKGGTLNVGIVSADPITGMFNPVFYLQATDREVMGDTMCGALATNEAFQVRQDYEDGFMNVHLDRKEKTWTMKINKDLKWSNGEDVTAEDIIATYELMGNPEYKDNVRYNPSYENIEGMAEFHAGKAKTISGIEKIDNKTVKIHLKVVKPSELWGESLIPEYLNAKQIAKVKDFSKFAEAELNTKPLSYGPYVIDKVVGGESVLCKKNPYFYKAGDVKIDQIKYVVVPPAQISEKIKAGDIDIVEVGSTQYDKVKNFTNGTILGTPDLYMSYVGFKLGKFDKDKGEVVVNPKAKAADVRVRQAFAYAVDWDAINLKLFKGLKTTPTGSGAFPPVYKAVYKEGGEKFTKNVEKAKELLKEAGYKDVDGDGLVEDKDGKKLTFNFAIRNTGSEIDEPLAKTFIDSWKAVGLDVKLCDGKLMSVKDFSKRVQEDDPSIDIFQGAWGLGTNPSPKDLYGKKEPLNLQRYTSDVIEKDLAATASDENFDLNKWKESMQKFDTDFRKELPMIPFSWLTKLVWVNNRVKHAEIGNNPDFHSYTMELLKDKADASK